MSLWLYKHNQKTIDHYNQLDENEKAIFDRLHSTPLKKSPGDKWTPKESGTYHTNKIFEDILPGSPKAYDLRWVWSYSKFQEYNIIQGHESLYDICPWIDPYFDVPYDYRQGMNNTIIPISEKIKDRRVSNYQKRFKPSIQHIVPQALGGPSDDIENIMIMPLRYNEIYSDMSPIERFEMIRALTNPNWKKRVEMAEKKFYKPKLYDIKA